MIWVLAITATAGLTIAAFLIIVRAVLSDRPAQEEWEELLTIPVAVAMLMMSLALAAVVLAVELGATGLVSAVQLLLELAGIKK